MDPTASHPPIPARRPEILAGLLGWIVPGLGQLYMGRPLKALLFFLAVVPAFAAGLWMTGFTAVNPSKYTLEFVAHVFAGGPTALALHQFQYQVLDSMPRWFEVGRLYASVGALLNVVAMSDAIGEALNHNRRVDELHRRAERLSYSAWLSTPAPATAEAAAPTTSPDSGVVPRDFPTNGTDSPFELAPPPTADLPAWEKPT